MYIFFKQRIVISCIMFCYRSELICRVKYCNTLPDIPFDPKFITYPFESTRYVLIIKFYAFIKWSFVVNIIVLLNRFIRYNPTSLERNYKYEVLTEHDLGVEIDLINKDTYAGEVNAQLEPADEKLLEEDVLTPQDSKRSRHHARSVSWLRRTEYISTEQTRFQPQTVDKVEAKVGYSIKKNFKVSIQMQQLVNLCLYICDLLCWFSIRFIGGDIIYGQRKSNKSNWKNIWRQ